MTSISAAKLRQNIYKILNDVNENSEPITITNTKGKNAVIILTSRPYFISTAG